MRWLLIVLVAAVCLAFVAYAAIRYWTSGRFIEGTDDAYVKADFSVIAPRVCGYVASVDVEDNQVVRAGQVVARLDDHDFQAALAAAIAARDAAAAALTSLDAGIREQSARIDEANARVAAMAAQLDIASLNRNRSRTLNGIGYTSQQSAQEDDAKQQIAVAQLAQQRASARASQRRVETLTADKIVAQARLQQAAAALQQAELNETYTRIIAPFDGTVGSRTVRPGQWVQPGSALMAVVPLQAVYVIANFKETQLENLREGDGARIHVDSFGREDLSGHVQSLSPASGLEFSLLPSDNATGNFTKIVQRIPVRITLDVPSQLQGRLRPGMSVQVDVTTGHQG
ncbi:HlyD family secretion protein [Pseudomonas gingeri]|uniref:HlyD family secretion protein n=1 Tax=Pseudomonas gingeri TaxID=117681 RepID=UPI001FE737BD|nr:HlyD family secretion protein [Pseudomonas gingeri]